MAVVFAEMEGFPQESYTLDEFTATRKLICDWGDRYALYAEIVGARQVYPYPVDVDANTSSIAIAVEGNIGPFTAKLSAGPTTSKASYQKSVVTVIYKTPGVGDGAPGTLEQRCC